MAADRYVEGVDRILSFEVGAAACLREAIEADPGFAMARATLALVEGDGGAQEAIAAAEERASRRERGHIAALTVGLCGDWGRSLDLIRGHLIEFPRDALLVHVAAFAFQSSGRPNREAEHLELVAGLAPHFGTDWWFLSAHAFALHETGRLAEARRLAEQSLVARPGNAAAAHSLTHVFYYGREERDGIRFLGDWMAGYDRAAPLHCHLSWHLALLALASNDADRALEIYERDVRASTASTRLLDASSLLWRCRLRGLPAETEPDDELRAQAWAVTARPSVGLSEAHAGLVHAAAGDQPALDRLIQTQEFLARLGHPHAGDVVVPLLRGLRAFAEGDFPSAVRHLEPAVAKLVVIGGSRAQREVFEETLFEAYLRGGEVDAARMWLRGRLEERPSQPGRSKQRPYRSMLP
jgi:tetratricopeptide (TPR) repeat protein